MTTFTQTAPSTNYSAEIIEVHTLLDLPGLDNLKGLPIGGYTALVSKDTQVGDILVAFPAESQISDTFLAQNNLYRHPERNRDILVTGYVEDNRRVKAIKLRGHASNALTLPASTVGATAADVGTLFDTVDGNVLVQKYEVPRTGNPAHNQPKTAKFASVNLPVHADTENWWRNEFKIDPDTWVTVSQKVHGTSVRLGRILVPRAIKWWERFLIKLGARANHLEYAFVVGSRKVIKSVITSEKTINPDSNHFFGFDLWSEEAVKYADLIPDDVLVFGELIGWTKDGSPIQKGYTYDVPKGEARLLVYRVAVQGNDGKVYDLSWAGVEAFCAERGLATVPVLWQGRKFALDADEWVEKTYYPEFPQAVPLSKDSPCDEGIVIRAEGVTPYALKAKSQTFLAFESKNLDAEVVDIESGEN